MDELELLYRGSLKSCNYRCSYCPFSRHRGSGQELLKDRRRWEHFVCTVEERAEVLKIRALLVTPYGEALIHPWYWEGLGRISQATGMDAVGAQTNLSFQISKSLSLFDQAGGDRRKLRLWATFHPEMVSVERFFEACMQLTAERICFCVGGVGVPGNLERLRELRRMLPETVYLWVNPMDGLGRPYTEEEIEGFSGIDPYFPRELCEVPAKPELCRGRLFAEGNGRLRICNISRSLPARWDGSWEHQKEMTFCGEPESVYGISCGSKRCSCYLAHGGQKDFMNRLIFGDYPIYRIPRRPKAVFLDVMGTLLPEESARSGQIPVIVRAGLTGLKQDGARLFLATTLPYEKAMERCRTIRHLLSGGIFLGGALVILETESGSREYVQEMEENGLSVLERLKGRMGFRVLEYRWKKTLCKVTLLRPRSVAWSRAEEKEVTDCLLSGGITGIRVFTEGNCLQVVSRRATKAEGAELVCKWLGIRSEDTVAAGDSDQDKGMQNLVKAAFCTHVAGTSHTG